MTLNYSRHSQFHIQLINLSNSDINNNKEENNEFYNDNSPIYEKTDELGNQNLWILIKG